MKVVFVMNSFSRAPTGGLKIIYTYANALVQKNCEVHLIFCIKDPVAKFSRYIPYSIRRTMQNILIWRGPSWFELDTKIRLHAVTAITNETIPNADAVFATAVGTALPVAQLSFQKGKKIYLIQGFENWDCTNEEVYQTYRLGMVNITVAKWLSKIVDKYAEEPSICISNGIDSTIFALKNPIGNREKHSLIFHYRSAEYKGGRYAFEVCRKLKEYYADLKVTVVSIEPPPEEMPSFCKYLQNVKPAQIAEINNNAQVFLCTSVEEGFGLPALEAMACGCALVSTSYRGVLEYTVDGKNSLLAPIKDVDTLTNNIIRLFKEKALRDRIAEAGAKDAKAHTQQIASEQLYRILTAEN